MSKRSRCFALLALVAGAGASFGQLSHAAEEVVVPYENPEPPVPIVVPETGGPGDIVLSATQSCYGQNNRATANSARATDNSTISQVFSFELSDGKRVHRRITRAGSAIGPQMSPTFTCTKVVANGYCTTKANCENTVGTNIKYSCDGVQHDNLPKEHQCSLAKSGNITSVSCAAHNDSSNQLVAAHMGCRLKGGATKSGTRFYPAQIMCRHYAPKNYASNTIVESSEDGRTWVRDSSAVVEISRSERFQVRLKGLAGVDATIKPASVRMAYNQDVPSNAGNCGFGGCDGPLTHRERNVTALNKALMVNVAFAGADGFCGGYHSPLMLFFAGERLPKFSGESQFKMGKAGRTYSWPEAGAGGWLLALDSQGNRKVLDESQLFGNNDPGSNGFEALAVHDDNKDGVINSQDKVFSQLLLWNDKNGDSVSQKKEVKTLPELGVVSISLAFDGAKPLQIGDRATAKERSVFQYQKKGSRSVVEGAVFDIWFAETN